MHTNINKPQLHPFIIQLILFHPYIFNNFNSLTKSQIQ